MTRTPSRAERAALAAESPAPRLPVSRADFLLDAYDPATASPTFTAQVQALQDLKAAYWRTCDLAHAVECLSGNPRAVYDHKQLREHAWLMEHASGSRRYLPWVARWPKSGMVGLSGLVDDAVDEATDWVKEVRSRIAKTIPLFDAAIADLCVTATACLAAALPKVLVYEYIFDTHAAWLRSQESGVGLPWYWTTPRRLTRA